VEEKLNLQYRPTIIRTPDYRLRVFVSSSLRELVEEREAVRQAILELHLIPVMFESGARPHPAKELYQAYLSQSHIFLGIYWQSYGWIAPNSQVSGLEDEYNLSADKPRLIYIKDSSPNREPALVGMLDKIRNENTSCYKHFSTPRELREQVVNDLVLLLTEYFETARNKEQILTSTTQLSPTNVPTPRNSLIGRTQDLQNAQNLILREDVALVTLTGPGGTGKSRLGIQIALDLRNHFTDGVYFIGLESILDSNFVIPAIAETVGIRETTGGQPIIGKLKEYLANKKVMLLLDNFEHLLPAAPRIAELLESCTLVKALVTSRAPLHLRFEKEFHVLPLSIPQLQDVRNLQSLSQNNAVELFVQRAQAIQADFQLTNKNAHAVVEICQRLDGLPLAIELAAAHIRILSPQALLTRLSKSFDILSNGTQDLPDRQRTLYNAIDWSFSLLNENEKRLFRRLSVFVGGWNIDTAEEVCSLKGEQKIDFFAGIEKFIDNSLIKPPLEFENEPRFTMFETIREYADYRLSESGEKSRVRANYIQHFLRFAEEAELELKGPRQLQWINKLESEHDNLRIALEYSLASVEGKIESEKDCPGDITALRLSAALYLFWFVRGYWDEGREWLRKALTICSDAPPDIHAKVLNAAGLLAWHQGDAATARLLLTESMEMCQKSGDKHNLAYALTYLGIKGFWNESSATARTMETESAALFEELADKWGLAYARFSQGRTALWQGNYLASQSFFEQSVALFLELGDRWHASEPIRRLGYLALREGDHIKADEFYKKSLEISLEISDKPGIASGFISLGEVALFRHDYIQAVAYYQESLAILMKLDDKLCIALAKYGLSTAAAVKGNYTEAERLLDEGITLLRGLGDKGGIAWMIQEYGHMMICRYSASRDELSESQLMAEYKRLVFLLCEGLALAQELGHIITAAFCTLGLAGLTGLLGQCERATRLWGAAEVLRLESQGFMSTIDKIKYTEDENTIRSIFDPALYLSAYDEGRAMTRQQVEAHALKEKERF
jgi:predicted ATPase